MELILKNKISQLKKLAEELERFCIENNLPHDILYDINLSLDELVTNIISYGLDGNEEHEISLAIVVKGSQIEIIMEDTGVEFNPLNEKNPKIGKDLDDMEIGGLGIYFVKKKMDEIHYDRINGKNILKMIKKF